MIVVLGQSNLTMFFQQELEDAEFIPMPDESGESVQGQLSSFSKSVTRPYEELKELKAAAEAVTSEAGLVVLCSVSLYFIL